MISIKKIVRRNVPEILSNQDFWETPFLIITKHRLIAHYYNPTIQDNDIVLLLAYLNNELVGYMGLYCDEIWLNSKMQKIGWLSTWWVNPKTKGKGVGRELLNHMHKETKGKIGISQFTSSAKRVYDKSQFFVILKENIGIKAVLRSNLQFVLPAISQNFKPFKKYLQILDLTVNLFVNIKLFIQSKFLVKKIRHIKLDYVNDIDNEVLEIINKFNSNDLSKKDKLFFEWMKKYPWVQTAPLFQFTEKNRYEFSSYDIQFDFYFIKLKLDHKCIGFIVLQKRNYVCKVLFAYYDNKKHAKLISDVIKMHAIKQNTREIIVYDPYICKHFKKSSLFLYKRNKIKQSIISKDFNVKNFDHVKMNYGDGDCSFA